jgi:hypothetical protein
MLAGINSGLRHQRRRRSVRVEHRLSHSVSSRSLVDPIRLPWLIHPLSHKFICYYSTEELNRFAINNVVCTVYNSICSLATTTAAIVVLGDWFPALASLSATL